MAVQYFEHDTMAGGDDKIIALRLEHGGAAVDAYWTILEQIYRDESALVLFGNRHANRTLAHRLSTDEETLEKWVSTMVEVGLLEQDESDPNALISRRAAENIAKYREKCETARQNGKKGGRKPSAKPTGNQGANRTLTERQANKRKENKGIGSHKENQIPTASDGAAAVETAPPQRIADSPHCPLCDAKLYKNTQTGRLTCPACCETFPAERFAA